MGNQVTKLFTGNHAIAGLYVGLAGAICGELLPTPTDPIDFYLERKWRIQLEKEEITPKQYWRRMAAKYYLLDSCWWGIVLGTAIIVKGDIRRKAMAVGGVIGAGAAISIIAKNIRKDTIYFEQYKMVPKVEE